MIAFSIVLSTPPIIFVIVLENLGYFLTKSIARFVGLWGEEVAATAQAAAHRRESLRMLFTVVRTALHHLHRQWPLMSLMSKLPQIGFIFWVDILNSYLVVCVWSSYIIIFQLSLVFILFYLFNEFLSSSNPFHLSLFCQWLNSRY